MADKKNFKVTYELYDGESKVGGKRTKIVPDINSAHAFAMVNWYARHAGLEAKLISSVETAEAPGRLDPLRFEDPEKVKERETKKAADAKAKEDAKVAKQKERDDAKAAKDKAKEDAKAAKEKERAEAADKKAKEKEAKQKEAEKAKAAKEKEKAAKAKEAEKAKKKDKVLAKTAQ